MSSYRFYVQSYQERGVLMLFCFCMLCAAWYNLVYLRNSRRAFTLLHPEASFTKMNVSQHTKQTF